MEFRKASETDITGIMHIIRQAQIYLREMGINQWQNNYPNAETIQNDIRRSESYVLTQNDLIIVTAAASFDGEKTYDSIYEGQWIIDNNYAVIHRIAVDAGYKGRGAASVLLEKVEDMCLRKGILSLRVDTHEMNISMRKFMEKNGFLYCGIIYLEDKSRRLAFEKIIKE